MVDERRWHTIVIYNMAVWVLKRMNSLGKWLLVKVARIGPPDMRQMWKSYQDIESLKKVIQRDTYQRLRNLNAFSNGN